MLNDGIYWPVCMLNDGDNDHILLENVDIFRPPRDSQVPRNED